MPQNKVLKLIRPISGNDFTINDRYDHGRSRRCIGCSNKEATQVAEFVYDMGEGNRAKVTKLEKYCDDCINTNKHLEVSDFIKNFDNYFVKRTEENWPSYTSKRYWK